MQPSYRDLLSEILTIIRYSDTKREQFIREFEYMNQLEAVENSIKKFPQLIQETIRLYGSTPEKIISHIDPEAYYYELLEVSAGSLTAFLKHIDPVINHEQKEKIAQTMRTFAHV